MEGNPALRQPSAASSPAQGGQLPPVFGGVAGDAQMGEHRQASTQGTLAAADFAAGHLQCCLQKNT